MSEQEFVNLTKDFFGDIYVEEKPCFNRIVDLIVYEEKINILKTFEYKLSDWKKAVSQAKDHQIIADFAYIVMPIKKIPTVFEGLLIKHGIGLYLYNKETAVMTMYIDAIPKQNQLEYYKAKFIDNYF